MSDYRIMAYSDVHSPGYTYQHLDWSTKKKKTSLVDLSASVSAPGSIFFVSPAFYIRCWAIFKFFTDLKRR